MCNKLRSGEDFTEAVQELKSVLPHSAAMKQTSVGTAVMADNWNIPIVFPPTTKILGWADNTKELKTEHLWAKAYEEPISLKMGAVGNSNLKPEHVKGGCSKSKYELSNLYESSVYKFFEMITNYLKEQGAKTEDIGIPVAHSYCGIDKALLDFAENNKMKIFGITPTEYTKYIRGIPMPPTEEFPNGYLLANFQYPTILTRDIDQFDTYANVYGKMVGPGNPLGIINGGTHSFKRDTKEAVIGQGMAECIPVDIMKDWQGIDIPAIDDRGVVINASRYYIERINNNPYAEYNYAFKNFLPNSKTKEDLKNYPPAAAYATVAYNRLFNAGKVDMPKPQVSFTA